MIIYVYLYPSIFHSIISTPSYASMRKSYIYIYIYRFF